VTNLNVWDVAISTTTVSVVREVVSLIMAAVPQMKVAVLAYVKTMHAIVFRVEQTAAHLRNAAL
jgi:hypothetical protein